MAQAQVDIRKERYPCKFCNSIFKSEAGHMNHMHRIHPLDVTSGLHRFTCNKAFTRREVLHQHYQTVRHQINCKKLQEPEIEDKSEKPPSNIREAIQKRPYRNQLMERIQPERKKIQKTPVIYLRTEPAIIPLESTVAQSDPRKPLNVSFIDLVDIYNENPSTENTENQEFCKEKEENIETKDRTVSRDVGLIHGHPSKSPKTVENELNQEKHIPQKPTDLPGSIENGSFAAIKEIEDFSTISDTDLQNSLINEDLSKNQEKMTFSAKTEEILLDLPS